MHRIVAIAAGPAPEFHRATLYRRWGNRENLILDALLELGSERVPIPDTGSLRGDLAEYGKAIVSSIASPEIEAIVRAGASVKALAETTHRFWASRLDLAGRMVERAISRGEVPPDTDPGLVVEAVVAAIYFRLLMSGEKLNAEFVERVADLVAAGASAPGRCRSPVQPR